MFSLYSILLAPSVKAMNGNRGRMVVQSAHGFIHALWDAEDRFPDAVIKYRAQIAFKKSLIADTKEELDALHIKYRPICGVSLVEESGSKMNGEINEKFSILTCLGIGPIHVDQISEDIRALKVFL